MGEDIVEDNRFVLSPTKRYLVNTVCGGLIIAISGAEIAAARCHKESCREPDAHNHPFEFPVTNNNYLGVVGLTIGTATVSRDYIK